MIQYSDFTYRSPSTLLLFFFFNDTATTEIYTLSLHDALPISTDSDTLAVALDQARPQREGEREIQLLGDDGADQHLDGSGRQGGSQAVERLDEAGQRAIGLGQTVEAGKIEIEAEQLTHFAQHGVGHAGGPPADDAHEQFRIVDGPLPAHLVRHELVPPTHDPAEHAFAQTVHGILAPDPIAGERGSGVERSVRGENDVHRIITRSSSVSKSLGAPAVGRVAERGNARRRQPSGVSASG